MVSVTLLGIFNVLGQYFKKHCERRLNYFIESNLRKIESTLTCLELLFILFSRPIYLYY